MNLFKNRLNAVQLLLIMALTFPSCADNLGMVGEESTKLEEVAFLKSEMLQRINEVRIKGCDCGAMYFPPTTALSWNSRLSDAAGRHAGDMATNNFYDHKGSDGATVGKRAQDAGYAWSLIGENIAMGRPTAAETVNAWMESPGHCRNIMAPEFREMGAATQDGYWVQVLARAGN